MSKHFIYHIFGKKIGVTSNVVRRMKEQSVKEGEYEILEEHTNAKTASVREQELQVQHGYRVDNIPYWKTLRNAKKSFTPEAIAKKIANTDYKAFQAKRIANIDYKARTANTDYKASRAKIEKSVIQFDKQDNFIKKWKSATEAKNELGYKDTCTISACLTGKQKKAQGYVWKYAN
jgi:hypothetical protein